MTATVLIVAASDRARAARTLRRELSGWRTPRALVAVANNCSRFTPVTVRIEPSAAIDLRREDKAILRHADRLVLVASDRAAESAWIDEMARTWRAFHPDAPAVVSGDGAIIPAADDICAATAVGARQAAFRLLQLSDQDGADALEEQRARRGRSIAGLLVASLAAAIAATVYAS